MPPRSDDPRRDATGSRRGSSRGSEPREPGLGGISDARAYTPRGRTVREGGGAEQRRTPRSNRSGDPFRPALQVLDGGRAGRAGTREPATDGARAGRRSTAAGGRAGVVRTVSSRPVREPFDDEEDAPPPRRRSQPRRPDAQPRRPVRKPRRPPRLGDPRRRLRLGTVLALALFASIGVRLVYLQTVDTPAYADGGLPNRLAVVELPAPRGAILDRDGEPLAHSVEARYVFADPTRVKDRFATARLLSPLLGVPVSDLAEKMRKRTLPGTDTPLQFVYLARGVEIATAKRIMALDLAGINVHRDERREVPGGDLAANLIGFVSQDMNGLEGLEAKYDDVLRGQAGKRTYEVGLGDLAAPIPGGYSRTTQPQPGSSLKLTVDRDLQFMTQRILAKQTAKVKGSVGAAVIIEVPSGEVLAQASQPTYDAANPTKVASPSDRDDAATTFVVDPGSIHKAITFGAALQEGVITPDTAFPVANTIDRGGVTFRDTHPVDGRTMSIPGMLAFSSNVGTIEIGEKLGKERLFDYQKRFGLGQVTGEGMPGEAAGRLLPPDQWSGSAYGSVPIGHSVDATPLQMAAAYATIANNGTYVQPHLVKETIGADGERSPAAAPTTRSVLSPANAAALRRMMEAVTTVDGPDGQATGLAAAVPGYRVAGKTGTGLRYDGGKQQPGEVGSFIGMAPAENPRYVVAVFVWSPGGGGGAVAAPAFREMMGFTLRHYRVPPSLTNKSPKFEVFPR
ncbi:penicillin-binding protein 2 [Micromonospora sp. WMMA1949]|uniref:peptidoglycan D,D-transpeptidase FtsI family protein n=1 Tax=unclassified Micromonospora TaxID=2617518 RepID=UPI0022B6A1CD|nr:MULTISPECIES: penicillin-binding protein 2 [unclassified Micromonospora]MCZ7428246.1 penicillin-binding protein 2 [Micromonospora sp. WMMA1949]WBC07148.1 penicillin-binding protein 2 [Micromonospora sp. WMMA1947]